MASLKDLRRRIRATRSMQQIFKAMEMVAAAKLRRAQLRAQAASPYARKITEMLARLAGAASELEHPLFKVRPVKTLVLVVVTADRGFAGSYNTNVLRVAEQRVRQAPAGTVQLLVVGRKGRDYFRRRGVTIIAAHTELPGEASLEFARRLTAELSELFIGGTADRIEVLYTHFVSVLSRRVQTELFLPVGGDAPAAGADLTLRLTGVSAKATVGSVATGTSLAITGNAATGAVGTVAPNTAVALTGVAATGAVGTVIASAGADRGILFEPDAETIFGELVPRYATAKLYAAMADALASEHAARMVAMGSARKNAGELVDSLTLTRNRLRQAAITREIAELVGGAEALR